MQGELGMLALKHIFHKYAHWCQHQKQCILRSQLKHKFNCCMAHLSMAVQGTAVPTGRTNSQALEPKESHLGGVLKSVLQCQPRQPCFNLLNQVNVLIETFGAEACFPDDPLLCICSCIFKSDVVPQFISRHYGYQTMSFHHQGLQAGPKIQPLVLQFTTTF